MKKEQKFHSVLIIKKSKTYKNIGYLSEKNKGISNIKLREKKNNNRKININCSIPETLQQSEIYQWGALPEYVDLTIERLSQTLFDRINPNTGLPKWKIVNDAKEDGRAIFFKTRTKCGDKTLMYFPKVTDLTANSPRLYHNYKTTSEALYLSIARTSHDPPQKPVKK